MSELLNKESVKRVQEFIKKFEPNLKILFLDTNDRTGKDASNFLICLVAGDKRCSLNKLKKILDKKDVSMANAEEVKVNTGFSIGGVAPVGHLKKLNILIDKSLSRFQYIYGAAGHPDCVFKITYSELIKLTNGSEKEVIK